MEPIKLGIVGLGDVATPFHLPLWQKMRSDVRVVVLCDVDRERLERTSKQPNVEKLRKH